MSANPSESSESDSSLSHSDNNLQDEITNTNDTSATDNVNESDDLDDDFDDDFGDFEEPEIAETVDSNDQKSSSPITAGSSENAASLLTTDNISNLSTEEMKNILPELPSTRKETREDVISQSNTCSALWQRLTEVSTNPLPTWSRTLIHKKLATILGLPLNLDDTLPQKHFSVLKLPSSNTNDTLHKVPGWEILSRVSPETLSRMSTEELQAHINALKQAIKESRSLQDGFELKEMDLKGEKSVLEGMVESLLVFSQRSKRENIKGHMKPTKLK